MFGYILINVNEYGIYNSIEQALVNQEVFIFAGRNCLLLKEIVKDLSKRTQNVIFLQRCMYKLNPILTLFVY
jgi:hypothetical protein